jgi:hypothetical protein
MAKSTGLAHNGGTHELPVHIGDITLGVRCHDAVYARVLQTWCGKFVSEQDPDFWIDVDLVGDLPAAEVQQVMSQMRLHSDGSRFATRPPLFEGEISLANRLLRFKAERNLFHDAIQPRFLNVLLSSVYNTVCEQQGRAVREMFLFHSCGVQVDGRGYLFTGPSGAGKTTVARLAGERDVLNDEVILLQIDDGQLYMTGTPLLGAENRRSMTRVPVRAVLTLLHGDGVRIRPLEKQAAFRVVLTQLFAPDPFFLSRETRRHLLERQMAFSAKAANLIRGYEMEFLPDGSFWPLVEML